MTRLNLFVLGMSISVAVCAQQDVAELERIVVTASRIPVELRETGSSISVITREQIERRQAGSITDLLRDVPGMAVSQSGGIGSRAQIRVRGAEANHVLVMIDGVEVNDPAANDEFQFEHLSTSDIERIEIVRGPQSALWGTDAVGGVINVITRSDADRPGARGFVETGSFGTTRLGGQFDLAGDRHRLRFGLGYLDADGTNIARSGDEEDGYRNASANLTGGWALSDSLHLTLAARHTKAKTQFDAIDFVQTGLPVDADRLTDSRQSQLNLSATYQPAGPYSHRIKLTYLDTASDELEDTVPVSSIGADKIGLYYQGTVEFEAHRAGSLTFAIDREQEDFTQRGTATDFGDPNQDQRIVTTGYVVEYRFNPVEALNLSTSVRHDRNSDFDSVTTYRATGVYRLADEATRLRASVGTGQKSPTFVERFGFFPDSFLGGPALQPEKSRGWEVGLDRTLFGERLSIGATYFDEALTNEINGFVFDATTNQFTAANIDGVSHRRGVELSAQGELTAKLRVSASYTRLDSTEPDSDGQQLAEIRRPEHLAAFNVNYARSARLNLNLNAAYNGSQLDTFFPPFPAPAARVELAGYTLVSVAASLAVSERLELIGRVENLLDEHYEDVYGFSTAGAAAYIGLRTRR